MGDPHVCAFCALPKAQVRNLIAGDGLAGVSVGICERCVGTSYDLLVKNGTLAAKPAAPKDLDAGSAIRNAVRTMPRSIDVKALASLASAGIELAAGNAAALRSLAYELGNAMAFEEALRVRAGVAAFERTAGDALAESAYHTRIGNAREGVAVLDRLSKGPLAAGMTPTETTTASMARMYAQLTALPWDNDVRAIESELATLAPKLDTLGLDPTFSRALQNQVVHIRARAAMALHREAEAIRILSEQLAVRELDLEALALLIEATEKTGDRGSAARAREKALKHIPVNSAYAKRVTGAR
jgi:hypothetical protein